MVVQQSWAAFFSQLLSTLGSSSILDMLVWVFICLLRIILESIMEEIYSTVPVNLFEM